MAQTALEKLVDGRWIPVAIRRQKFTVCERKNLFLGSEVTTSDGVFRRANHDALAAEHLAFVRALGRTKN